MAGRGGVPADADAVFLNLTAVAPDGFGFLTAYPCGASRPLTSNVNYSPGDVSPNSVLAKIGTGGKVCIYTKAASDIIADVNGFVPAGGTPGTVVPSRILETRVGPTLKTIDGLFQGIGKQGAGATVELQVAGRGGVPGDAEAAFLNVTAIDPDGFGYVTVFPCGESRPLTSNINYTPSDVAPNSVFAKIGTDGKVCIFTLAAAHLIVDVSGHVPEAAVKGLVEVSFGANHGCGLDDDGGVTCWGYHERRADDTGGTKTRPACGCDGRRTFHRCGVRRTCGTIVRWGSNSMGKQMIRSSKRADAARQDPNRADPRSAWTLLLILAMTIASGLAAVLPGPQVATASHTLDLVSLVPARVLETRVGPTLKTIDGEFEGIGKRPAGATVELTVAGRGGVPVDADAVFLNLTAVSPDGAGYLTAYPCGATRPLTSNVNYGPGDVVPNAVLAKIGAGGKVCIFTLAASDIIADVNGYVPPNGSPNTAVPARVLETRVGPTLKTIDGEFEGIGKRPAGATVELTVAGRGGVPADADAVFLNLTAVAPDGFGFLTAYPCGSTRPLTSNVNYVAG